MCLYQVMMTLYFLMASSMALNRLSYDNYVLSSPGWTWRTHVESRGLRVIHHAFSKRSLVNLISKDTHLVFSVYHSRNYTAAATVTFTQTSESISKETPAGSKLQLLLLLPLVKHKTILLGNQKEVHWCYC